MAAPQIPKRFMTRCTKIPPAIGRTAHTSLFSDWDVIPDYRCQGIAAALMDHMIEDAKNKGRKGLILTCKDRLIHYYAKFGYKNRAFPSLSTAGQSGTT